MAEIRVQRLRKSFGDFAAVKDSTFTINDGEFFCLLGPSGCGKTTTLRMIAGLELPTSGQILLDGEDVTFKRASRRDIAMVFQLFALYPHMNVRANISYPLRCAGLPRAEIAGKVAEIAGILRIEHLLDRPVSSGPLYGTLFLTLGKTIPAAPTLEDIARSLGTAIDAVKARGKSETGQKTLLDVLAPVHGEFAKGGADLAQRISAVAMSAAEATKPMKALRGRASFLGERSIGHVDPGACSSALMVGAVCKVLEG